MLFNHHMLCCYLKLFLPIVVLGYAQASSCQHAGTTTTKLSLKEAITEGNWKKFEICLDQEKERPKPNPANDYLLHWACYCYGIDDTYVTKEVKLKKIEYRKKIMAALLQRDENMLNKMLNKKDEYGLTPLHYAVKSGFQDGVDLLLKAKADPNIEDNNGLTPLQYALSDKRDALSDKKIFDKLVEARWKVFK